MGSKKCGCEREFVEPVPVYKPEAVCRNNTIDKGERNMEKESGGPVIT